MKKLVKETVGAAITSNTMSIAPDEAPREFHQEGTGDREERIQQLSGSTQPGISGPYNAPDTIGEQDDRWQRDSVAQYPSTTEYNTDGPPLKRARRPKPITRRQ